MKFLTISEIIDRLEIYREKYGDIPVLLGIKNEDTKSTIYPLTGTSIMDIKSVDTQDSQRCLVFANRRLDTIEDFGDDKD